MDIELNSARLRRPLFGLMALVVLAGVAVEILGSVRGWGTDAGAVPLLSLSYEWNLPTVYTAVVILACAALLALAAAGARRRGERGVAHWWTLAAGFVLMGLDELLGFHELVGPLVRLDHLVHFDWIVPAAALLAVLAAVFWPFVRRLPGPLRRRFLLAGVIYVGGAVCMEVPLGWWTARHGSHNLTYGLVDALEEALEMLGLNLFLLALLDHLAAAGVGVRFGSEP